MKDVLGECETVHSSHKQSTQGERENHSFRRQKLTRYWMVAANHLLPHQESANVKASLGRCFILGNFRCAAEDLKHIFLGLVGL